MRDRIAYLEELVASGSNEREMLVKTYEETIHQMNYDHA